MLAVAIILNLKNRIFFDVKISVAIFLFGVSFFHWAFDADIGGWYLCLEKKKTENIGRIHCDIVEGNYCKIKKTAKKVFHENKSYGMLQNIQYYSNGYWIFVFCIADWNITI